MSGVQTVGVGGVASVLGTQFVPAHGAAGQAARVALAMTGVAAGVYVLFALGLITAGVVMRWAATRQAHR